MSHHINRINYIPAFGYEIKGFNSDDQEGSIRTKFKLLGYLPIIGNIMGIVKLPIFIIGTLKKRPEVQSLKDKHLHIIRASVEGAGLGFLLLVPDLIMTFYNRQQYLKKQ